MKQEKSRMRDGQRFILVEVLSTSDTKPSEDGIQTRDGRGFRWLDLSVPQHFILLPSPCHLAPDDGVQPYRECKRFTNPPGNKKIRSGSPR